MKWILDHGSYVSIIKKLIRVCIVEKTLKFVSFLIQSIRSLSVKPTFHAQISTLVTFSHTIIKITILVEHTELKKELPFSSSSI